MNNVITLRKAERHQVKLKIGIFGPTGSGKTYSALKLARGMASDWNKIALIDTENGSGDLYSNLGDYNVITLSDPFTPERYAAAIKTAEEAGMEIIVIDSVSHEWDGKGGILDYVDSLGGRLTDWSKATPRHRLFIQSILQSTCHVITTARTEQDYSMEKDAKGKTVVTKVGLKEIQRKGFDYEMTIAFTIDHKHLVKATKDRTGVFMPLPEFIIDETIGTMILEWNKTAPAQAVTQMPVPEPAKVSVSPEIKKIKREIIAEAERLGIDWKAPDFKDHIEAITGFTLHPDNLPIVLEALKTTAGEKDIADESFLDSSTVNSDSAALPPETPNLPPSEEVKAESQIDTTLPPLSPYRMRSDAWLKATIATQAYKLGVKNDVQPDFQVAIEVMTGLEWKSGNLVKILTALDQKLIPQTK